MTQHPGRIKNMARRRAAGLTHKELGEEFNMSGQHAGRLLRSADKDDANYDDDDDEEC